MSNSITITYPDPDFVSSVIDGIRGVIGFPVIWYIPHIIASSGINPISGDSLDSFNPIDSVDADINNFTGYILFNHE